MFYYLSQLPEWLAAQGHTAWADWLSPLRVFQYITFRGAGAAVTALLLCWWLGPRVIRWLQRIVPQEYEDRAHPAGETKRGIPTMGGLLIVGAIDITALLWGQWNPLVTLTLLSMLVLCLLGFFDDYMKIARQEAAGLTEKVKWVVQFSLAIFVGIYLLGLPATSQSFMTCTPGGEADLIFQFAEDQPNGHAAADYKNGQIKYELRLADRKLMEGATWRADGTPSGRVAAGKGQLAFFTEAGLKEAEQVYRDGQLVSHQQWVKQNLVSSIMLPFVKHPIRTGAIILGVLLVVAAIVGSSNAVNLTDGLDGLAIGSTVIVSMVFLIFTYIAGNKAIAGYLQVPYVAGAGELAVVCAAMMGAGLGFLWFNCFPARVFMGDTGSLALGGSLGLIAILIHQPFVLAIAGGVFVLEGGSSLLQRGWFKWTRWRTGEGQRLFLMAPLHHHFQKKGWHENQIVVRFFILGILFAVLALATLKLR